MIICFDTESPVGYTPNGVLGLVCLTYAFGTDETKSYIARGREAIDLWLGWLRDDSVTLLGHSIAHDMCTMAQAAEPSADPGTGWAYELVFRAYDAGRVQCSYIRQRLIDIAAGVGYLKAGLGPLVKRYELGETREKNSPGVVKERLKTGEPVTSWPQELLDITPLRLKYGLLVEVPFDEWPRDALEYALLDPVFTFAVFGAQSAGLTRGAGVLANEHDQVRAAFDLEILSKHGWATDLPRVKRLLALYGDVMAETYQTMRDTGLVSQKRVWPVSDPRHRVDESLATAPIQALVWDALGTEAPLTKKAKKIAHEHPGDLVWYSTHISTNAETCTKAVAELGAHPCTELEAITHLDAGDLREWISKSGCSAAAAINARRLYKKAQHKVAHYLRPLNTSNRVRSHYTPLLVTGRTSTSRPCLNYPRGFAIPEHLTTRGCIVVDPGRPFLVVDYAQLEMRTLAQALTDLMRWKLRDPDYLSSLAKAINEGMDVHVMVAAAILDMDYDECASIYKSAKDKKPPQRTALETQVFEARQVGKIGNFGYGGGMGAKTFVHHAAKQGVLLSLKQSERVKHAMLTTWIELDDVHHFVNDACKRSGNERCGVQLPRSGLVRGNCYYTQARNFMFQGTAAVGCKEALRRLNDATYRTPDSTLYQGNARGVAFIHDEFIFAIDDPLAFLQADLGWDYTEAWDMYAAARYKRQDARDEFDEMIIYQAERALRELERHMVEGMRVHTPDVQIVAEGRILTERWSK